MSRLAIAVLAAAASAVVSAPALAQNETVIKERKAHYEAIGKAVKQPGKAFKGDDPFDLGQVQNALKLIQEKAAILPRLFPEDSKTGADTEAKADIWANKEDFEIRFKKLAEDARAVAARITDEATFKAEWKGFMGNCSGCHKKYREDKD